jgi:sRNA-binding carbon storage regulator CsrA
VASVQGDHVRLGIRAPATVRIDRHEVHERRSLCPPPKAQISRKGALSRSPINAVDVS